MLPVAGKPFIEHKLASLHWMGFDTVHLLIGHRAHVLAEFVASLRFPSLRIRTHLDGPELLGTGGSIKQQLSNLPSTFWVTYADSLTYVDFKTADDVHCDFEAGVMTVMENSNGSEPSNVGLSDDQRWVTTYDKQTIHKRLNWIDFGLLRLNAQHFADTQETKFDLSSVLLGLIRMKQLRSLITDNRYFDIGTEATYAETNRIASARGSDSWWN
jgi:NDP-sugar pyrophosphorylase family protein